MGSGFNHFTNGINVSPSTTGAWVDVDVSSYIPSDATGVIVEIVNAATTAYAVGVRKNGSTDGTFNIYQSSTIFAYCGVDSNRIFEAYRGNTSVNFYLIGYTDSFVGFFDNKIDKTPSTTGSWVNIDASTNIPSDSVGVIVNIVNTSTTAYYGGVRKNGSTDTLTYAQLYGNCGMYELCGVDSNRVFQAQISNTAVKIYLVGYVKSPIVFLTNATDVSITTTSAWTDKSVSSYVSSGSDGIILMVQNTGSRVYSGLVRKKDSTDNFSSYSSIYNYGGYGASIGIDANKYFQGYINNTVVKFYLMGYPAMLKWSGNDYFKSTEPSFVKKFTGLFPHSLKANEILLKRLGKIIRFEYFRPSELRKSITKFVKGDFFKVQYIIRTVGSFKRFVSERLKPNVFLFSKTWQLSKRITEYGERVLTTLTTEVGERVFDAITEFAKIVPPFKITYIFSFTDRFKNVHLSTFYYFYKPIYYINLRFRESVSYFFYKILTHVPISFMEVLRIIEFFRRYLVDVFKLNELFKKMMVFRKSDFMKANSLLLSKMWQYVLRITEYGERVLTTLTTEMGERVFSVITEFGKIVPPFKFLSFFAEYFKSSYSFKYYLYKPIYYVNLGFSETLKRVGNFKRFCADVFKQNEISQGIMFFKRLVTDIFKQNETFNRITSYMRRIYENYKIRDSMYYFFYKILTYVPIIFTEVFRSFGSFKRYALDIFTAKERMSMNVKKIVFETLKISLFFYSRIIYPLRRVTEYGEHIFYNIVSSTGKISFANVTEYGERILDVVKKVMLEFPRIGERIIFNMRKIISDVLKASEMMRKGFNKMFAERFRAFDTLNKIVSYRRLFSDRMKQNEMFNRIASMKRFLTETFRANEVFKKIAQIRQQEVFKVNELFKKMAVFRRFDTMKLIEQFRKTSILKWFEGMKVSEMFRKIVQVKPLNVFSISDLYRKVSVKKAVDFFKTIEVFRKTFSKRAVEILKVSERFKKSVVFKRFDFLKSNEMFNRIVSFQRLIKETLRQNEMFNRITFFKRMFSERFKTIEKSFYIFYKIMVYAFLSFTETFKGFILFKRMFYEFLFIKERTVSMTRKIVSETLKINSFLFSKLVFFVRKLTEYGELVYNNLLSEVGERVFDAVTEFGKIVPKPRISAILFDYLKTSYISSQRFIKKTIEQFKALESMKKVFTKVSVEGLKFIQYPLRFVKRLFDMISFSLATRFSFTKRFTEPMKILGIFYSRLIHFVVWITEYGEHVFYNLVSSTGKISLGSLTEYGERVINIVKKMFVEGFRQNEIIKKMILFARTDVIKLNEVFKKLTVFRKFEGLKSGEFYRKMFVLQRTEFTKISYYIVSISKKVFYDFMKVNSLLLSKVFHYVIWLTEYGEHVFYNIVSSSGKISLGSVTEYGERVINIIKRTVSESIKFLSQTLSSFSRRFKDTISFTSSIASLKYIFILSIRLTDATKLSFKKIVSDVFRTFSLPSFLFKFKMLTESFKVNFIYFYKRLWSYIFRLTEYGEKVYYDIVTEFGEHSLGKVTELGKLVPVRLIYRVLGEVASVQENVLTIWHGLRVMYDSFKANIVSLFTTFVRVRIIRDFVKATENVWLKVYRRIFLTERFKSTDFIRTFGSFKRFVFENLKVSVVLQKISYTIRPLTDLMKTTVSLRTRVSKVIVDNIRVSLNMLSSAARRLYDSFKITDAVRKISFVRRMVFDVTKVSDVIRKNVLLSRIERFKVSETLSSSLYRLYRFIVYDFFKTSDYIGNIIFRYVRTLQEKVQTREKVYFFFYKTIFYTSIRVSDTISKMFKKTVYDKMRFLEYRITRFTRRTYDVFSSREYIFLPIHYLRTFVERLSVSFSLQKTFTKTIYSFMKTTETLRIRFSHLLSDFMLTVEGVSKTVRTLFTEALFSVTDLIWKTVRLREYLKIAEKFIPFSFREVLKMVIVGSMRTYYSLATNMLSYLRLLMENRQLLSIRKNVFQTYVLVEKSVKKAYNILKNILNTLILLLGYKR